LPFCGPAQEKATNRLINIMARSRFFKGDIGYHLVRSSMVIIFVLFGYQKWWEYAGQGGFLCERF
jgi:hypothetical protein